MLLTADDFTLGESAASLQAHVAEYRDSHDIVKFVGKNPIDPGLVRNTYEVRTSEEAESTARFVLKSWEHASYIYRNPSKFLPVLNGTTSVVTINHGGIKTYWSQSRIQKWINVKASAVEKALDGIATRVDSADYGQSPSRLLFIFNDKRLAPEFTGNPDNSLIVRAYLAARRNLLVQCSNYTADISSMRNRNSDAHEYGVMFYTSSMRAVAVDAVNFNGFQVAVALRNAYSSKISSELIQEYRQQVYRDQAYYTNREHNQRRQLASANFDKYWNDLKTRISDAQPRYINLDNKFIELVPALPAGTLSSRTWGIEIETVRGGYCTRPPGWEETTDGSLTDSGSCDCYDNDEDCNCDNEAEGKEFVSPILNSFNSSGLLTLCDEISNAGYKRESDTTPGIHVHVGAGDLSVTDIARLMVAYSAVSRLIEPLYHREVRNYCKDTTNENLRWWLSKSRDYIRNFGSVPAPRDICHDQPADRYYDVNLYSLAKHGTVEFRAMGPYYSYDHLVRWAWFVREMVNVSKLGIHQREWTSCRSFEDVIAVLRKYGSEIPSTAEFANISTSGLDLSLEYDNEADGE
jgi:hypothetical protein